MSQIKGLKVVITIVDRKKGDEAVALFEEIGCHAHYIFLGNGTASKEILEYLGFGIIEKDVIISIANEELVPEMFQVLEDELDFDRPGKGVACSIPVSSIAGKKALEMILNKKGEM